MLWVALALTTAFCEALKDVAMKQSLRSLPAPVVAWVWVVFALPVLAGAATLTGIPELGEHFWPLLLIGGSINTLAFSLYAQALQDSDLSTSVPMIAFTPLFLLITSPLIVGEFPGGWGLVGVVMIVAGSYVLHIQQRHNGLLAPFRALLRERGPRLVLVVALLWSIGATVDKVGISQSSPFYWVTSVQLFIAVGLTPLVLLRVRNMGDVGGNLRWLLLMSFFSAMVALAQMQAITLTLVAYVIAIKRINIVLSVLFGALFFQEQGWRERLLGVAIMLLGVCCITLL